MIEDNGDGYQRVRDYCGGQSVVYVHQLVAIADGADPGKVFSNGVYHVHHRLPIPWLNIPGNLELVHWTEHVERESHVANLQVHGDNMVR